MSITGALNAALSGLTATARRAEAVSSNVANAATPGYGRREVQLSSGLSGALLPGVTVQGVSRKEDLILLGQRRDAQAGLGHAETAADFLAGVEDAIGLPGAPGSLSDRMTLFETALISAASRPDSESRLIGVLNAARGAADHLNLLSDHVQDARLEADRQIEDAVGPLNTALDRVVDLNARIIQFNGSTRDTASLIDQRQRVIDGIADLVPIKQMARPNGAVALYSENGGALVDSKAAVFGFDSVPALTVHMTQAGGGLSGLTLNGRPVDTGAASGPIAGGRLAGLFEIRDVTAPGVQTRLDAVARDLIERFQDPAIDPTLGAGDPGLFTDAGTALDLTEELGLAGRIALNDAVDPGSGGAVWRMRSGLNAAAPGDVGDATMLNALGTALDAQRLPASGGFSASRSAIGLAGDLLSVVSVAAFDADARVSFASAQNETLLTAEYQDGVDTDAEMQELLLVEQAYAANARVMSTIDTLIQRLLEI